MDPPQKPAAATSLFQVFLRLRPPQNPMIASTSERFLTVEPPDTSIDGFFKGPTHVTLEPPSDSRKRAVERFGFTKVFQEDASQVDIFTGANAVQVVAGVLQEQRDGLIATLGVTGSGKSHTILGSKSQRGLTQMSLDVLFQSLGNDIQDPELNPMLVDSLAAADPSEANLVSAATYLENVYGEVAFDRSYRSQTPMSRAQTPMTVGRELSFSPFYNERPGSSRGPCPSLDSDPIQSAEPHRGDLSASPIFRILSQRTKHMKDDFSPKSKSKPAYLPSDLPFWNTSRLTQSIAKLKFGYSKDVSTISNVPKRHNRPRPSSFPLEPDVAKFSMQVDHDAQYAVIISMYEVYNDRIFDLLTSGVVPSMGHNLRSKPNGKDLKRRPLLFKPTEMSTDRKVVAGLRKIVCANYEEAMSVLETGLMERRVTGTGSNSVSSRSHGFFCVEVKKRWRPRKNGVERHWHGSTLTVVDLAGSERARNAKTAGATLAEAGKINESLMYLGQCLQIQSLQDNGKSAIVPFRQCKLTELLFSNSFPSSHGILSHHRTPQKAIMIVTADPLGDFNATSQILRYSALAREITVPRAPSASSMLSGSTVKASGSSGRSTPNPLIQHELELAAAEIARLSEDVDILTVKLAEEGIAHRESELARKAAEDKCEMIEQDVREECWTEMERLMEQERRRWKEAWGEEADRNDERVDKKLEILTRSMQIYEDVPMPDEQHMRELEDENAMLRRELDALKREFHNRSPTKSKRSHPTTPSKTVLCETDVENTLVPKLKKTHLDDSMPPPKSLPRRHVKLAARKWNFDPDEWDL